jgi:SulP family sulfate permease
MAGSVFGAIPAGGSMSGTAVTVQAGAQSRWANIFGGLFIIVIIFLLVDVVKLVPMAALGGLLLVVGLQNIQPADVRLVWQTGMAAKVAMAATLLATLILPLQFAILVGVAISFLLHVLRSANRVEVRELVPVEGGFPVERPAPSSLETGSITVLRIRGSLFFASAQAVEAQLPKISTALRAVVILSLRDIDDLGSTVIRLLKRYASDLERRGGQLVLAGVNDELRGQLERTGFAMQIGNDAIFQERPEIGMALNEAIEAARGRIEAEAVQDGDRP